MKTPIIELEQCHLKAVCALETFCFSKPWNERQLKDAMHSPHFHLYGYLNGELLLAYLLATQIHGHCEIINIATNPEHRRKGYAYQLLDNFFQQHTKTCTQTVLEVRSQNIAAQELYKKFDFVQIDTRKNYYGDNGEDAFVMKRT